MTDKTKLVWHSNAPHTPTGYGQQTALFAPGINQHYDLAISSYFGVEGAPLKWTADDGTMIPVFPGISPQFGEEWLLQHANRWFGGNPRDGLVVTLMDVWPLNAKIMAEMNTAAWVPVDHEPAPQKVVDYLVKSGAVPIAMSRFGERMLGRLDPLYCPHAVDCTKYQPMGRNRIRELTQIPEDTFVVGMVAANKGRPGRKGWTQAIQGFAQLLAKHENSVLYLHTMVNPNFGDGEHLAALLEALDIPEENVRIADQYSTLFDPFGHKSMAMIYSNLDVLLNPSMGEGFGCTQLEAQACGIPVIATDFSAMPEVVGSGWLVKPARGMGLGYFTGLEAWQKFPDVDDIAAALEDAYNMTQEDRERRSRDARAHALEYDLPKVLDEHMLPALRRVEQRFASQRPVTIAPRQLKAAA